MSLMVPPIGERESRYPTKREHEDSPRKEKDSPKENIWHKSNNANANTSGNPLPGLLARTSMDAFVALAQSSENKKPESNPAYNKVYKQQNSDPAETDPNQYSFDFITRPVHQIDRIE